MIPRPSCRRLSVAVMLACCFAAPRGADARTPDEERPAGKRSAGPWSGEDWRLELAAGRREGLRPERITADESTWLAADPPADDAVGPGAAIEVPTRAIVSWGRCPPWPVGPMVLLADGGVIAGRIVVADGLQVAVASNLLGRIVLPAGMVRGYRASTAIGPAPAIVDALQGRGVLRLSNDDRLLARRIDWRDGRVSVETSFGPSAIPADVVRAVDWAAGPVATGREAGRPTLLMALVDGSRLWITALHAVEAEAGAPARSRFTLEPDEPAGNPVMLSCDSEAIVALAVGDGAATRLATLDAAGGEPTTVFGRAWPPTRGRAVAGAWPALRGATGCSSLGLHAPARVRYRLARPAQRFETTVGIDDAAGPGEGSVVVRILAGDAAGAVREVFVSPLLRGGEPPVEVRVDLADAAEIELIVEPGDDGPILDRTLWLDPRVIHR